MKSQKCRGPESRFKNCVYFSLLSFVGILWWLKVLRGDGSLGSEEGLERWRDRNGGTRINRAGGFFFSFLAFIVLGIRVEGSYHLQSKIISVY